jgi:hypothetical protein
MKTVSFYDPKTGLFTGQRYSGPESGVPSGAYVEGEWHPASSRVETSSVDGELVALAVPREVPDGHTWHAPAASFIEQSKLDRAKRDAEARAELASLDASQHRALLEHALGDPEALERLRAIHARKAEVRKELASNAP